MRQIPTGKPMLRTFAEIDFGGSFTKKKKTVSGSYVCNIWSFSWNTKGVIYPLYYQLYMHKYCTVANYSK